MAKQPNFHQEIVNNIVGPLSRAISLPTVKHYPTVLALIMGLRIDGRFVSGFLAWPNIGPSPAAAGAGAGVSGHEAPPQALGAEMPKLIAVKLINSPRASWRESLRHQMSDKRMGYDNLSTGELIIKLIAKLHLTPAQFDSLMPVLLALVNLMGRDAEREALAQVVAEKYRSGRKRIEITDKHFASPVFQAAADYDSATVYGLFHAAPSNNYFKYTSVGRFYNSEEMEVDRATKRNILHYLARIPDLNAMSCAAWLLRSPDNKTDAIAAFKQQDKLGNTPLHYLAMNPQALASLWTGKSILSYIMTGEYAGGDIRGDEILKLLSVRNKVNKTPMMCAAELGFDGHIGCFLRNKDIRLKPSGWGGSSDDSLLESLKLFLNQNHMRERKAWGVLEAMIEKALSLETEQQQARREDEEDKLARRGLLGRAVEGARSFGRAASSSKDSATARKERLSALGMFYEDAQSRADAGASQVERQLRALASTRSHLSQKPLIVDALRAGNTHFVNCVVKNYADSVEQIIPSFTKRSISDAPAAEVGELLGEMVSSTAIAAGATNRTAKAVSAGAKLLHRGAGLAARRNSAVAGKLSTVSTAVRSAAQVKKDYAANGVGAVAAGVASGTLSAAFTDSRNPVPIIALEQGGRFKQDAYFALAESLLAWCVGKLATAEDSQKALKSCLDSVKEEHRNAFLDYTVRGGDVKFLRKLLFWHIFPKEKLPGCLFDSVSDGFSESFLKSLICAKTANPKSAQTHLQTKLDLMQLLIQYFDEDRVGVLSPRQQLLLALLAMAFTPIRDDEESRAMLQPVVVLLIKAANSLSSNNRRIKDQLRGFNKVIKKCQEFPAQERIQAILESMHTIQKALDTLLSVPSAHGSKTPVAASQPSPALAAVKSVIATAQLVSRPPSTVSSSLLAAGPGDDLSTPQARATETPVTGQTSAVRDSAADAAFLALDKLEQDLAGAGGGADDFPVGSGGVEESKAEPIDEADPAPTEIGAGASPVPSETISPAPVSPAGQPAPGVETPFAKFIDAYCQKLVNDDNPESSEYLRGLQAYRFWHMRNYYQQQIDCPENVEESAFIAKLSEQQVLVNKRYYAAKLVSAQYHYRNDDDKYSLLDAEINKLDTEAGIAPDKQIIRLIRQADAEMVAGIRQHKTYSVNIAAMLVAQAVSTMGVCVTSEKQTELQTLLSDPSIGSYQSLHEEVNRRFPMADGLLPISNAVFANWFKAIASGQNDTGRPAIVSDQWQALFKIPPRPPASSLPLGTR